MQIGNWIGLASPEDSKKKLFRIITFTDFVACMSEIAGRLRDGKELHVQLVGKDKYKFHEVRTAYFSFLGEVKNRADHDGRSIEKMHEEYKAEFLIPLLSKKYDWFADLVLESVKSENPQVTQKAVAKLITVADGSIVTTPMLREFFKKVQLDIESQKFETIGGE